MVRAIADGVRRLDTIFKALPWPLIGLAGLFQQTPRKLRKMRYLWRTPVRLDNSRLVAFSGSKRHTPLAEAMRTTLRLLDVR